MAISPPIKLTFAVHQGGTLVRREVVAQQIVKVGRDPKCHLKLGDDAARMHLCIEVAGRDNITVIDMGNEPATKLNGAPINKAPLRQGDTIEVGGTSLTLEQIDGGAGDQAPAPEAKAAVAAPAVEAPKVEAPKLEAPGAPPIPADEASRQREAESWRKLAIETRDERQRATYMGFAAARGHALAQADYAWMLLTGYGLKRDAAEGLRHARLSAAQGNLRAKHLVAACLLHGDGVARDVAAAAQQFRELAEQGDAAGQCSWGFCLLSGTGVARDAAEADRYFRLAAEQWDADAARALDVLPGAAKSVAATEAIPFFRLAAEHHDEAAIRLATALLRVGGEGEQREAALALERAAKNGAPRARVLLAGCLRAGFGVSQNARKAFKLYRSAAEQGDAEGQYYAGVCLRDGIGTDANLDEASRLLKLAEEQGYRPDPTDVDGLPARAAPADRTLDPVAQLEWAVSLLREGKAEGLAPLRAAAQAGLADAQYVLGVTLLAGEVAPVDVQAGLDQLELAMKQAHASAAFVVYQLFEAGEVVKKDEDIALRALGIAAGGGHPQAQALVRAKLFPGLDAS